MLKLAAWGWSLVALAVAWRRSLWADEWNHVQDLKLGLAGATREIFKKPSPFAPGEVWLNWFFKTALEPLGFGMEIWARAQGVMWGALTIAFCAALETRWKKELRGLTVLTFFSCALLSYATEMRPYASLYCSGAAVLLVLLQGGELTRWQRVACALVIGFGHLYGVCFLAAAYFVTKPLRYAGEIIAAAAVVLGTLASVSILPGQGIAPFPGIVELTRQLSGTFVNPHRAIFAVAPFFALGLWQGYKVFGPKRYAFLMASLVGMTALPLGATWWSRYFFVPRQTAAATVPFLVLCALGLSAVMARVKPRVGQLLLGAVITAAGIVPWVLTSLMAQPPFPSQPFHRFREVAEQIVASKAINVASMDVCNNGPVEDYFARAIGSAPFSAAPLTIDGVIFEKKCWHRTAAADLCVSFFMDPNFCTLPASSVGQDTREGRALREGGFDVVLHGFQEEPTRHWASTAPRFLRDW